MKFIGSLLLFCCMIGAVKAQTEKPAPLILGKNDTIKTYLEYVKLHEPILKDSINAANISLR